MLLLSFAALHLHALLLAIFQPAATAAPSPSPYGISPAELACSDRLQICTDVSEENARELQDLHEKNRTAADEVLLLTANLEALPACGWDHSWDFWRTHLPRRSELKKTKGSTTSVAPAATSSGPQGTLAPNSTSSAKTPANSTYGAPLAQYCDLLRNCRIDVQKSRAHNDMVQESISQWNKISAQLSHRIGLCSRYDITKPKEPEKPQPEGSPPQKRHSCNNASERDDMGDAEGYEVDCESLLTDLKSDEDQLRDRLNEERETAIAQLRDAAADTAADKAPRSIPKPSHRNESAGIAEMFPRGDSHKVHARDGCPAAIDAVWRGWKQCRDDIQQTQKRIRGILSEHNRLQGEKLKDEHPQGHIGARSPGHLDWQYDQAAEPPSQDESLKHQNHVRSERSHYVNRIQMARDVKNFYQRLYEGKRKDHLVLDAEFAKRGWKLVWYMNEYQRLKMAEEASKTVAPIATTLVKTVTSVTTVSMTIMSSFYMEATTTTETVTHTVRSVHSKAAAKITASSSTAADDVEDVSSTQEETPEVTFGPHASSSPAASTEEAEEPEALPTAEPITTSKAPSSASKGKATPPAENGKGHAARSTKGVASIVVNTVSRSSVQYEAEPTSSKPAASTKVSRKKSTAEPTTMSPPPSLITSSSDAKADGFLYKTVTLPNGQLHSWATGLATPAP